MFELVKRKEGFETKLQALESPDSINERKDKLKRKSDQKSRSEIIAENPRKRKTDEQINERTFVI